ncbi:MAG: response regulator [Candidatus Tectimicrobiota bacterium]
MPAILIIDDDQQVRWVLRQMLEREGYVVFEAANGREGIRQHQHTPVDLVITDILMPEQEGLETIQALQRLPPVPRIIAISGGTPRIGMDFLPQAAMLGAQRTLQKPVRRQELLEAVQALLAELEKTS